jgi:hypothetical protein
MEPYDFALGAEAVHAFTAQPARERERLLQILTGSHGVYLSRAITASRD